MSSPEITFLEKNDKRYLLQSTKGTEEARQKFLRARERTDEACSQYHWAESLLAIAFLPVTVGITVVSRLLDASLGNALFNCIIGACIILGLLGTLTFLRNRNIDKEESNFNDVLEEELSILPHIYAEDSTIEDAVDALKVTGYYFDDESMTVKPSKRFAMNDDLANEFLDIVRTATGLKELESANSSFIENELQADWFDEKKKEYASSESLLNQKKEDFKNKLYAEYNLDIAAGRAFQNELIAK